MKFLLFQWWIVNYSLTLRKIINIAFGRIYSANNIKECPVGQKSYKSIQIYQIFLFFDIEICFICIDLKDFSPQATQKNDSLNSYLWAKKNKQTE